MNKRLIVPYEIQQVSHGLLLPVPAAAAIENGSSLGGSEDFFRRQSNAHSSSLNEYPLWHDDEDHEPKSV